MANARSQNRLGIFKEFNRGPREETPARPKTRKKKTNSYEEPNLGKDIRLTVLEFTAGTEPAASHRTR